MTEQTPATSPEAAPAANETKNKAIGCITILLVIGVLWIAAAVRASNYKPVAEINVIAMDFLFLERTKGDAGVYKTLAAFPESDRRLQATKLVEQWFDGKCHEAVPLPPGADPSVVGWDKDSSKVSTVKRLMIRELLDGAEAVVNKPSK